MASAFWGGFADTMLGERQKAQAMRDEEASMERMARKKAELGLEYTRVDDVVKEGENYVRITRDGNGNEVRRVPTTKDDALVLQKMKIAAEAEAAVADAEAKAFGVKKLPEEWKMKEEKHKSSLETEATSRIASRASANYSNTAAANMTDDNRRLQDETDNKNSIDTAARAALDEIGKVASDLPSTTPAEAANKSRRVLNASNKIKEIMLSNESDAVKKYKIASLKARTLAELGAPVYNRSSTTSTEDTGGLPVPPAGGR